MGRCFDRPGTCQEIPATRETEPAACPGDAFAVTRCVTGGMPVMTERGPRAHRSCTMQCEPAPPMGSPGMRCRESGPRRYTCEGYAP
jgi:hypothetical protein